MSIKKKLKKLINQKQINRLHKLEAMYYAYKYRFPAKGMIVFGVTGTKGKTTTCHMLASILSEAGYKVGLATTVGFQIGDESWMNETNKSNIHPRELQALIRRMKDARCDVLILEATSIGIDQHRLYGIPFQYVGLTNIAHDHLDYHINTENYIQAKLRLFKQKSVKSIVINADDPTAETFLKETKARRKWSYSTENPSPFPDANEHLYADKIYSNINGANFSLVYNDESEKIKLQLPGRFSVSNALCAAGLALNLNLKIGTIAAGLENLQHVPGRLEIIETKKGFSIIIDYAHTPDSLEKLYSTLRPDVRGKMIAVLGSCGDRDRTKRPIMGALASRFCDNVIITDEEPYNEDPLQIIDEVAKGVPRGRALYRPTQSIAQKMKQEKVIFKRESNEIGENDWWWKIVDRRVAISKAIDMGKMDDLVIITGMGSQSFRIVKEVQEPWKEREIVEQILKEKNLL